LTAMKIARRVMFEIRLAFFVYEKLPKLTQGEDCSDLQRTYNGLQRILSEKTFGNILQCKQARGGWIVVRKAITFLEFTMMGLQEQT